MYIYILPIIFIIIIGKLLMEQRDTKKESEAGDNSKDSGNKSSNG